MSKFDGFSVHRDGVYDGGMPKSDEHDIFSWVTSPDTPYAAEESFLAEVIYPGLKNLNSGFDSPGVFHLSPEDFTTVIDRCSAMGVVICGIEVFDISCARAALLDVRFTEEGEDGLAWAYRVVEQYAGRNRITISATFHILGTLSYGEPSELE